MARTIKQIQDSILAAKDADTTLSVYSTPSAVGIFRLWAYIVAVCMWTLENLFDLHLAEVKDIIKNTKKHRVQWYATKALDYQHGYTLVPDEDYYDNSGLTEAQINASKIVSYSAAQELNGRIVVKVAKLVAGDLAALEPAELGGVSAYFKRIKDGGVNLKVSSAGPDSLLLHVDVYYDALLLDATGARIDGAANTPLLDGIRVFLKSNDTPQKKGLLVVESLVDAMQKVEGVIIPNIIRVEARYGVRPYQAINVEYLPDAGYLRIDPSNLILNYMPHEPI